MLSVTITFFKTNAINCVHKKFEAQSHSMPFGQFVIGPPGSGKTTYCNGMKQFLDGIGRKCAVVNLDPANENLFDGVEIDIRDLCDLETVMKELQLGPNGALLYCMEYLTKVFYLT